MRIVKGIERPPEITFFLDGEPIRAIEGESVAAALLAADRRHLRMSPRGGTRGAFCFMGVCQECTVNHEGMAVSACQLPVAEGMRIERRMFTDDRH